MSEAARLLNEPQHRLIYLCEKRVVIPDYGDARGRGSSRRFSARNLLEFVLAFRLRTLTIPVATIAGILYVLRVFAKVVAQHIGGGDLVDALKGSGAPTLHVVISDGERLFFSLGLNGRQPKLFGGIDFRRLTAAGKRKRVSQSDIKILDSSMGVECGHYVRIDVNVTRMARDLPLNR